MTRSHAEGSGPAALPTSCFTAGGRGPAALGAGASALLRRLLLLELSNGPWIWLAINTSTITFFCLAPSSDCSFYSIFLRPGDEPQTLLMNHKQPFWLWRRPCETPVKRSELFVYHKTQTLSKLRHCRLAPLSPKPL